MEKPKAFFAKFPVTEKHKQFNQFFAIYRYSDNGNHLTVYPFSFHDYTKLPTKKAPFPPDIIDVEEYGFYCKSIPKHKVLKLKGGVWVEMGDSMIFQKVAIRKWYFETKQKRPRRIKKFLLN